MTTSDGATRPRTTSTTSTGAVIATSALTKRYGATTALAGVDLSLGRGVTGILGPNGAGKTTLLRILATVLAADAGTVSVRGHDPATADGRLAIRRELGYLPQEPGFHRHFTAFEFADYVAILKEWADRRERHDEVRRVLALVGLEDVMHRRIRHLSGGMRRRLGIAQAIIGRPSILVLDEPTAGLDPEQRLRFRELLGTEAAESTVVLSTHQTDDVAALCNEVVVLLGGEVRFVGAPSDVAALARDRVWIAEQREPAADLAWITGDGLVRHIGRPPAGARLVDPTVEDGYLVLAGADGSATTGPAAGPNGTAVSGIRRVRRGRRP
jgi:ABC-2 type transport system ATP-binding protein